MNAVFLDSVGILGDVNGGTSAIESGGAGLVFARASEQAVAGNSSFVLLECGDAAGFASPYGHHMAEIRREFRADGMLIEPPRGGKRSSNSTPIW